MERGVSTARNIEFYQRYYSQFARRYDSYVRERSRIVARCLLEWASIDGRRILDLGIGTASVWEHIQRKNPMNVSVLGIDIVPAMLDIARSKSIPWVELREGDILGFDDDAHYDLVLASSVLRHLANPSIGVLKAYNLLTESGELLVEEQTLDDSHYQLLPRITDEIIEYWKPSIREDSFMMSEEELLRIVSDAGFEGKRFEEFSYNQEFKSFEEIRDLLITDTMWGMTYRKIEKEHRRKCDEILLGTLKDELKEPVLPRGIFVSLHAKATS
jgi:ubiquinone/menaquinone biosynthesis C-methylase UbiE